MVAAASAVARALFADELLASGAALIAATGVEACAGGTVLAPMVPLAVLSVIGGFILLASAFLLIFVLIRSQIGEAVLPEPLRYTLAVNPPVRVPRSLNGFALWNAILLVFMIVTYGYPIAQFFVLKSSVPVYEVTRQSSSLGVR